jgi:L-ribulokinase
MQIYADITGRPMKVSRSEQTPALGAAMFGAIAAGRVAGGYSSADEAQRTMTGTRATYLPDPERHAVYSHLYSLYRQLHDAFGTKEWTGGMHNVMKDLLELRDEVRSSV